MKDIARLFAGFDGAGEGMRDAGFGLAWGIEKDDRIAAIARANGHNVITVDVLDADPAAFSRPYGIHASPPCINASLANSTAEVNDDGTKETALDRALAAKTIHFVEVLRPRLFTLENVWQYRLFQSFQGGEMCEGILPALARLGYKTAYWHINAADYGVPQTRRRLILVASLDFAPQKPWETHYDPTRPELAQPSLIAPERTPWVGWYEAIEDLIPTLPESQFAPWQLARLPEEIVGNLLIGGGNTNLADAQTARRYDLATAPTVMSTSTPGKVRAFLVDSAGYPGADGVTVPVIRAAAEPSNTVVANFERRPMRAYLVDGNNASPDTGALTVREEGEPSMTIRAGRSTSHRAWLDQGRVVKMTTRALARFQSFADTYRLSGNTTLDCKGIGNACPPLLFRRIYESLEVNL